MTKLCPRGKAAAKRKFKVYPSAYANAYASKICAGKIKDPSGVKRKDFKGRKPAMGGGSMNKRIGLKHGSYETVPPSKGFSEYVTKEKQREIDAKNKKANEAAKENKKSRLMQDRAKAMGGGMMKRASYMGGGLTEATQRLRRQGLKHGSVARGCGAIMSDRKKKTRMV